jgi:hypothetical protein
MNIKVLSFFFLFSVISHAQEAVTRGMLTDTGGDRQLDKKSLDNDTAVHDTTLVGMAVPPANLRNDDRKLNRKYHLWIPLADVAGTNVLINVVDRYALKYDYARISFKSWGNNLRAGWPWGPGWIWDHDPFGNNFLFHPITGNLYYNAARANGYTIYEAAPITFFGSYMWKIFGENGKPEREDLINTTLSGIFIGEITYRLSSDILDDRATGAERTLREIGAGIIDPVRAINRLLQGKTSRKTSKEVYEKEPLHLRWSSGARLINADDLFGSGHLSEIENINIDYGDPFEVRSRKPYDFFKAQAELDFGKDRILLDNAYGYGLLWGKNLRLGNLEMLAGAFQHWDYYDNRHFELTAIGFGPGAISRLPFSSNSSLQVDFHACGVPFGGNTTRVGPYSPKTKDYDLIGGFEAKLQCAFNIGGRLHAALNGFYYITHTYVGNPRDNFAKTNDKLLILNPEIAFRIYRNIGIGFEHLSYSSDRNPDIPVSYDVKKGEQKLYLSYYFGNFQDER